MNGEPDPQKVSELLAGHFQKINKPNKQGKCDKIKTEYMTL